MGSKEPASPDFWYVDIKGIRVSQDRPLPVRREVNDWAKDPENNVQLSLFIRALERMYHAPITDPKSFFQIASIHGYPGNLEWNFGGKPAFQNDKDDPYYIYCVHNSPIFPSWHRPYMLLFEVSQPFAPDDPSLTVNSKPFMSTCLTS